MSTRSDYFLPGLSSSYPGADNYGGWTHRDTLRTGVVHYFPSPFASSACSKVTAKARVKGWCTTEKLITSRFCATCVKVSQSWDRPPKIYSDETAVTVFRKERADRAQDIADAFQRASSHAFQVMDDYDHAIELMVQDGQPDYEIEAVQRELSTFTVLASLPAPREHAWMGYSTARRNH